MAASVYGTPAGNHRHKPFYTVYIKDLIKLNLIWQYDFKLEPIFATVPATSKNITYFNCDPKIIISLLLLKFKTKTPIQTVELIGKTVHSFIEIV